MPRRLHPAAMAVLTAVFWALALTAFIPVQAQRVVICGYDSHGYAQICGASETTYPFRGFGALMFLFGAIALVAVRLSLDGGEGSLKPAQLATAPVPAVRRGSNLHGGNTDRETRLGRPRYGILWISTSIAGGVLGVIGFGLTRVCTGAPLGVCFQYGFESVGVVLIVLGVTLFAAGLSLTRARGSLEAVALGLLVVVAGLTSITLAGLWSIGGLGIRGQTLSDFRAVAYLTIGAVLIAASPGLFATKSWAWWLAIIGLGLAFLHTGQDTAAALACASKSGCLFGALGIVPVVLEVLAGGAAAFMVVTRTHFRPIADAERHDG